LNGTVPQAALIVQADMPLVPQSLLTTRGLTAARRGRIVIELVHDRGQGARGTEMLRFIKYFKDSTYIGEARKNPLSQMSG
jgi:hypothetical protein